MDRVWAGQLINSSWSAKIWIFSWPDLVFWSNMREPVNSFQGPRAPQCSLCFLFINNHEFSIFSIINNKLLCLDLQLFSPAEIWHHQHHPGYYHFRFLMRSHMAGSYHSSYMNIFIFNFILNIVFIIIIILIIVVLSVNIPKSLAGI